VRAHEAPLAVTVLRPAGVGTDPAPAGPPPADEPPALVPLPRVGDPDIASSDELARRFLLGDGAALEEAYDHHARLVYSLALRALGAHHDAEDVTQQVFVRAWRGRAGFDPGRGSLGGWLVGITRRQIADRFAARARDRDLADRAGRVAEPVVGDAPDDVVDAVVVAEEIERLPTHQRDVVRLTFFADLTHQQISEVTGLPLGTVKSHLRRGLERLRRRWELRRVASGS
jgi:RNA polymerase sigma-70 factor (ECF subfamily)